jgi:hypothetical protein
LDVLKPLLGDFPESGRPLLELEIPGFLRFRYRGSIVAITLPMI